MSSVTLKLVQVYVTDNKGNPVTGLKREDFLIYDKGKSQTITEFEQHILSIPSLKADAQFEILQNTQPPAPRDVMSRKFFLFFDFAYTTGKGILKAKKAALHFIDTKLQPSDEVGVLSYSAIKSLILHENLTTNHEKVRAVVDSFGLNKVHGRAESLEANYWAPRGDLNPLDNIEDQMEDLDRLESLKTRLDRIESLHQAANFAQKIADFGKALRYIPGYKNLILFSSGMPSSMMYGYNLVGSEELRVRLTFEDMLKDLASSNCKIYTINTEDVAERFQTTRGVPLRFSGVFSLQSMSTSTGGKYLGHVDTYEDHLEKIQNLTGSYYVLGYYIDEKWDGKYHKITVKVKQKGFKVYAQKGYYNPKIFSKYSKMDRMLHLVDLALTENPIFQTPIRFPVLAVPYTQKGKSELALISQIPAAELKDVSGEKVEIVSLVFNDQDDIIGYARSELDISKILKKNIYHLAYLPIPPGEYRCRTVVRNLDNGRGAVGSSAVTIPGSSNSSVKLDPPLLLKPENEAHFLQEDCSRFPFDMDRYSPLVEVVPQGTSELFAVIRYSHPKLEQPDLIFSASLSQQTTENIIQPALSILNKETDGESQIVFFSLSLGELQPGEYSLQIFAEEQNTLAKYDVKTTFTVR